MCATEPSLDKYLLNEFETEERKAGHWGKGHGVGGCQSERAGHKTASQGVKRIKVH